jgi:hypothetical protein
LNPLLVMPLPLGGCGIMFMVAFYLANAALHKALFPADDCVRHEQQEKQ